MTFGEKIRWFAKQNFGNVSKLAEALNMHQPDLSNYINGKYRPGTDFYIRMRKLGCDINWLLDEDGVIKEPKIEYGVRDLEKEIAKLRKAIKQIQNVLDKLNREEL